MAEQLSPLFIPPHEGLLIPNQPISSIPDFVSSYFFCFRDPHYPYRIRDEIRLRHRSDNFFTPAELPLIQRFWLAAAEYGFPDVGEHQKKHRTDFQRKITDPLHIIAMLIYLARRNVTLGEKKQQIIEDFNLNPSQQPEVWNYFVKSQSEEQKVPIKFPMEDPAYSFTRLGKKLPILVPDLPLHRRIAQFDLTSEQADTISHKEFQASFFPQIKEVFAQFCNLDTIID